MRKLDGPPQTMPTLNPSTILLALSVMGWAATTCTSRAQGEVSLVPFTQTWRYNAWKTNLPAAWMTTNYADGGGCLDNRCLEMRTSLCRDPS